MVQRPRQRRSSTQGLLPFQRQLRSHDCGRQWLWSRRSAQGSLQNRCGGSPTMSPNPDTYTTPRTVALADALPGLQSPARQDGSTPEDSVEAVRRTELRFQRQLRSARLRPAMAMEQAGSLRDLPIVAAAPTSLPIRHTSRRAQTVAIADVRAGVSITARRTVRRRPPHQKRYLGPITVRRRPPFRPSLLETGMEQAEAVWESTRSRHNRTGN